jgi:hypothetical protein
MQEPRLHVPGDTQHCVFGGAMHCTPWHGLQTVAAFCGNDRVSLKRKSLELSSVSTSGEQPPSFRS